MYRPIRLIWAAACMLALAGPLLAAGPADQIRARQAGYKQLGAAYKGVNDTLRGGQANMGQIQQFARQIRDASRNQYKWFPAGSGPRPGVKTAAKSVIWAKGREFRAAQDTLARQADAFQRVAMGGNATAIRSEARKLGGACKACHDKFRESDD